MYAIITKRHNMTPLLDTNLIKPLAGALLFLVLWAIDHITAWQWLMAHQPEINLIRSMANIAGAGLTIIMIVRRWLRIWAEKKRIEAKGGDPLLAAYRQKVKELEEELAEYKPS